MHVCIYVSKYECLHERKWISICTQVQMSSNMYVCLNICMNLKLHWTTGFHNRPIFRYFCCSFHFYFT